MFKDVITHLGTEEKDVFMLSSHKVYNLSLRVSELTNTKFTKDDISFFRALTDYYFDTNYPSVNYLRIQEEAAHDTYKSTILFAEKLQSLFIAHIPDAAQVYADHSTFIKNEKSRWTKNPENTIGLEPGLLYACNDIPGYVLVRERISMESSEQHKSAGYHLVRYAKVDIVNWSCNDDVAVVVPATMTMYFMSGVESFVSQTDAGRNPVSWQDGTLQKQLAEESEAYKDFCINHFNDSPIGAIVRSNVEKSHIRNLAVVNHHVKELLGNAQDVDETNSSTPQNPKPISVDVLKR